MDADKKRIWIRGQFVEVTDEVYRAYMQGDRKMRYFENDLKTERFVLGKEGQVVQIIPSREDSLDRLVDENARQFSDEQESVESVVLHKREVDRLHTALSLLTPEERALIQALFFDERKESELAVELGISQPAVYKRKMKILKKLKISQIASSSWTPSGRKLGLPQPLRLRKQCQGMLQRVLLECSTPDSSSEGC